MGEFGLKPSGAAARTRTHDGFWVKKNQKCLKKYFKKVMENTFIKIEKTAGKKKAM